MSKLDTYYIKSCWLAQMSPSECAAEIIRKRVMSFGLVREKEVYETINTIYRNLTVLLQAQTVVSYNLGPIYFIDSRRLDSRRKI